MSRPGRGRLVFGAVRFGLPASNERERGERVVGDLARPDEIPQRLEQLGRRWRRFGAPSQLGPEARAPLPEVLAERVVDAARRRLDADRSTAAGAAPDRGRTGGPVRQRRRSVPRRPTRHRRRCTARRGRAGEYRATADASTSVSSADADDRCALQLPEHFDQTVDAVAGPGMDAVPCQAEPRVRVGLDGLDLAAQRCERSSPQLAQHVDVAPLALDAVGPELTADDSSLGLERWRARPRRARRGLRAGDAGAVARNGPCVAA